MEYSGCEHLIELSFTWLAWQNAGIIVREELYMLKSENPQTIGGLKPSSRQWMSLPLSGDSMLHEKALSDEPTENLRSFTHTRIIQIPCREHRQYQGKRTSVSQLEKLQKIQSPVKTRPWILVTKVIFPHWRPRSSNTVCFYWAQCAQCPEQGLTPNSCSINI